MFYPIGAVVTAFLLLMPVSWWCYRERSDESFAALAGAVIALLVAVVYLAYEIGVGKVSEEEKNDLYKRRKAAFEEAKKRLQREKHNLDRLLENPLSAAGDKYTEVTPFELLLTDLWKLHDFKGYGKLIDSIMVECRTNQSLPSGRKNVVKLMKILKQLDRKLATALHEERVWR